ncbi:Cyn operon transcriptional activator [Serratia quinivorans]|uniref:transcriptional regulator CynR n=1 Tax=Serratia quinivorans TaxID=137545 RepID=UPI0021786C7B|nr:transcriptional regulator CynR [Serratia quinivorans]CAI0925332.1 Cyn operon transcriptional activator [Serratia quinivorans]CAI0942466.1 Cyn operon transcriptional activator [Serratia quinivorans]CAI1731430.1 Cyn operon transcriptional activator [Serratia quinivorans]CAI2094118.1 Cyn operon transcriptional activator [Serratia quinivorans]CAI2459421.1 Cyn operon transcriptional activator [Serratia quinivorans]
MLLRHIRYFLAVAEQGNFTRAAEVLHVSQPTLSQQIKQLEETLGTPLLDRSGRTVRLTDAGAAWMRYARLALQDLDEGARAIHDVATLERGNLRLAMTPTFSAYLVGPVIDAFYRRYPGISLSIQEMTQDRIEALLAEDRLDLGIAFGQAQSPDIEATDLFSESLNMVVGADHLLAQRQHPLTAAELEREPLALLSEDFATRQFIDDYCRQQNICPLVAVEANAIGAILEIVRRGQLATILPAAIAQADTQLRSVQLVAALPARRAVLLQRKSAYRSAASQAFVAVLHQQDLMSAHSNPV